MSVRTPSYRLHKSSGQAVVTLDGRDHYLGRHGSPESEGRYRRLLAEWLAAGRAEPKPSASAGTTVDRVILFFWRHAEGYYRRPDGSPSPELGNLRIALRPLRRLYGATPAAEFGPVALKAVRQNMLDSGLCRRTINQRIARVVRAFRHAVEAELVPADVHLRLKAVEGLRRGRSGAKESRKVRPVRDEHVDAIRPRVSRQVWAMIELQRLTGMRSGEVTTLRTMDLDTSGPVWAYTPSAHKTEHHGHTRAIYLGPRAQEVIKPWLRTDLAGFLFQPREAMAEIRAGWREARRTPLTPSQRARRPKARPRKTAGERYDSRSYAHAIAGACDKAFPHPTLAGFKPADLTDEQRAELKSWRSAHRWHPHQLRHAAATRLRAEFGLEVTRIIMGHTSSAVTETYAEVDREKAVQVMRQVG